jgi:hypothetical protein
MLLPEGQTLEPTKPTKKQCCCGNLAALDRRVILFYFFVVGTKPLVGLIAIYLQQNSAYPDRQLSGPQFIRIGLAFWVNILLL